ncbi:MAG TPA: FAD-dependent oxidoreductase, partial [Rhizomicrobium sp.]|nr:FAD-dependent oxidoreductase [Rhizomicrobium sp.]
MNGVADIVIIGGGVNGLTAAAFLARAGKKVVLCEASNRLGGIPITTSPEKISGGGHVLYAADPVVIAGLKLARHGLRFAARDMALVGLRRDGRHVVLTRDS